MRLKLALAPLLEHDRLEQRPESRHRKSFLVNKRQHSPGLASPLSLPPHHLCWILPLRWRRTRNDYRPSSTVEAQQKNKFNFLPRSQIRRISFSFRVDLYEATFLVVTPNSTPFKAVFVSVWLFQ
ncbi:hypothetical protein WG66_000026 [Moniliophthora roreri]|nr:hypothetical protein WG66_000026 [Moniliophthora roreri]